MPGVTVILREGEAVAVEAEIGVSMMEAIRNAGIDEVVALCGGSCSCATCHVFVEEGAEALPEMGADEADMLECSLYRQPNSRLSCQLPVTAATAGLVVRIAPEE
ncbi:Rhodocoxin [Brevundimonas sp. SH203]|uniref:2Fe-2S iron-sulfur cluster-binding protein n=1 Tax=Brevundimonas sp. SH203 TaxID=345167 RepID=UPI0009C52BE7|nr:2Fe-2S iron-sulfur cluster-binding protein [Brevundimonas sp. SH203]GAW41153.1 Rhodocoxin [Brevundimonas sp. SH203]